MLPLHELQAQLADAMMHGDDRVLGEIEEDAPGAAARLQIYRNHYRITLIEALAATFPVVQRLVGEAWFTGVARRFVLAKPPTTPCLFEYGAEFPQFLAEMPEAGSLPVLSHVAQLEWAVNVAYHAPDLAGATAEQLAEIPPEDLIRQRLPLHPACMRVCAPYPVDLIWHANQPDHETPDIVDLTSGGVEVLVVRPQDAVYVWRLDPAEAAFVDRLADHQILADATAAAFATGEPFDFVGMLSRLIDGGALTRPCLP